MSVPLKKITDRHHLLAVALSASAVLVSGASLWQAHRALKVSEENSGAFVKATSVRLTNDPAQLTFLTFDMTLHNFGRSPALDLSTVFEWQVSKVSVPVGDLMHRQPLGSELAPMSSTTLRLQATRRFSGGRGLGQDPGLEEPDAKLVVFGVTTYIDKRSGQPGRDVWCFLFDPKDNQQNRTLEMRACEEQPQLPDLTE